MAINYSDFDIKNRIGRLLGQNKKENTADSDTSQEDTSVTYPKILNPFSSKQITRNADLIQTDNMNSASKTLFAAATGKPISYTTAAAGQQAKNTAEADSDTIQPGYKAANTNSETGSGEATVQAYADVDSSSLGGLDIATELPKLTVAQISTIIKQYFGNSKIMSESDAQGIYDAQNETGMSALAMLGIGALESGYGTSNIANKTNNIWGYGATNNNPEGNAHRYSQMSEGAKQFASEFMRTYYNGYGAKSINSAGTGSNPKGMGYAYNDDGSISSTWAPEVSAIMSKFYNTARGIGDFSTVQASGGGTGSSTSDGISLNTLKNSYRINQVLGNNQSNQKGSKYFTVSPFNLSLLRGEIPTSNTALGTSTAPISTSGTGTALGASTASDTNTARSTDTSGGNGIVNSAKQYLGVKYVYGGSSPSGFDCSGLAQYVYSQNGKSIPRTSQEQFKSGTAVSQSELREGDLVFFKGSGGSSSAPGHVGIYIGGGQYIQAPRTGDVVKISNLSDRSDYVGARRY